MVKTYYRNEYTEKQWKALIDKAAELGCQITYGRYGDRAEIDSTDRENGGYYTTKEFQAVSHKAAERQAERYTKGMVYGSLDLISVELKQENSDGE